MLAGDVPFFLTPDYTNVVKVPTYFSVNSNSADIHAAVTVVDSSTPDVLLLFGIAPVGISLLNAVSQMVRMTITIADVDVSDFLIGPVEIDWPTGSGGTARFSLSHLDNAFIANTLAEGLVTIVSTLTDLQTGVSTSFQAFTGIVASFSYSPNPSRVDVNCQDMSRLISHETDKIDADVYSLDPIQEDQVSCITNDVLYLTKKPDLTLSAPIIGIWNTTDTARNNNLLLKADYKIDSLKVTIVEQTVLDQNGNPVLVITAGQNYIVRYNIPAKGTQGYLGTPGFQNPILVPIPLPTFPGTFSVVSMSTGQLLNLGFTLSNLPSQLLSLPPQQIQFMAQLVRQALLGAPKSAIIATIADLAKITKLRIDRIGFIEDEPVYVDIVANKELPLDLLAKVCLPQTWIAEFNEYGILVIRREILKATPDWIYMEDSVIEETLVIEKSWDPVVNFQCVTGTPKLINSLGQPI